MAQPRTTTEILDSDFLETRSRVLDIAGMLDRIDRAAGAGEAVDDRRLLKLRKAIEMLGDGKPDRARRVQMLFSLDYEEGWRSG